MLKEKGKKVKYLVGTMVETPRAALLADQMAEVAEFFSFVFAFFPADVLALAFARAIVGVAVRVARFFFHLKYMHARMSIV